MVAHIQLPKGKIVEFCRKHNISKLSLFGSVLRDDFAPDSDVDVLVEFEPQTVVGLLDLAEMEFELSDLLERNVDIRTPAELSHHFRQKVLNEAEALYVC